MTQMFAPMPIAQSFVDQLARQGLLDAAGIATLRQARVRTADDLYALVTHFPSLADVDVTTLSAHSFAGLDEAIITEVAELEHEVLPASVALGAIAPDGAVSQEDDPAPPLPPPPPAALVAGPDILLTTPDPWPVRDQWHRGTCVAHAVVALAEHLHAASPMPDFSEQFLFAHCKRLDGRPASDGTWIDFGRQALWGAGVCDELTLRYNPTPVTLDIGHISSLPAVAPTISVKHTATTYHRVVAPPLPGHAARVYALLSAGRPVAVSVPVFIDPTNPRQNNWNGRSARDYGEVLDPLRGMIARGGHAVCLVGYKADASAAGGGWFLLRNSWGTDWGRKLPLAGRPAPEPGYGAISADYIERFLWEYCQL
jgi:Papain family cysteine protease